MNFNELSRVLLKIVKMYFAYADVIWSRGKHTQRKKPYITLKLSSTGRATHSTYIMENEVLCGYIPSKAVLRINLFTNGREINAGDGMLPIFENTAVADLEDFCNFVVSEKITDICDDANISITQKGDVLDVSELLDSVDSEYRAQVELDVDYMQVVTGAYGVSMPLYAPDNGEAEEIPSSFVPTPSGGRTEEQVNTETGYFIEVETESEEE